MHCVGSQGAKSFASENFALGAVATLGTWKRKSKKQLSSLGLKKLLFAIGPSLELCIERLNGRQE